MKDIINNFLLYIQFFTRIPVNKELECKLENFKNGMIFYPVIGLIMGGIQFVIATALYGVMPHEILAVLVLLASVLVNGGFHLDGLGDTCDAFFAFKEGGKQKRLDIMKDSRVGTFAVLGIIFDLLLKYLILKYILMFNVLGLMILIPMLARVMVLILVKIGKPAKLHGSGNILINNVKESTVIVGIVAASMLLSIAIGSTYAVITIALAIVGVYLFNWYCNKKIEGHTGDTLGALVEIMEVVIPLIIMCVI